MKEPRRTRLHALSRAAHQAWDDLKTAPRRIANAQLLFYVAWAAVLGVLVFLAIWGSGNRIDAVCMPDATFSTDWDTFKYWTTGFFEISLAFGSFSFAGAKALDVAFQLVVGRGGQALLAFLSWKAFSMHITVAMTEEPVTYSTFWAIFLHQEPTITSTYRLARDFYRHRRPGSVASAAGILLSILFLLAFPTAVNSMTGYMPVSDPYIRSREGSMIGASEMDQVAYIIHDGERIGKTDDYAVRFRLRDPLKPDSWSVTSECRVSTDMPECDLLNAVSNYTQAYGFYAQAGNIETTWNGNVTLPAPPLNISGRYFSGYLGDFGNPIYGHQWRDPRTGEFTFQDKSRVLYLYVSGGEVYDEEYVLKHGKCQPSADELYNWGFAFVQLFLLLSALLTWSLHTHITWNKARRRLRLSPGAGPEVPSGWRAVLALSRSMEAELAAGGIDVMAISDRWAKRGIRERLDGGAVSFKQYELSKGGTARLAILWAWLSREKWWVVAFFGCVAAIPAALFLGMIGDIRSPLSPVGALGWVPTVVCIYVAWLAWSVGVVVWAGSTRGSRLFMLVVMGLVGVPVAFSYYIDWKSDRVV